MIPSLIFRWRMENTSLEDCGRVNQTHSSTSPAGGAHYTGIFIKNNDPWHSLSQKLVISKNLVPSLLESSVGFLVAPVLWFPVYSHICHGTTRILQYQLYNSFINGHYINEILDDCATWWAWTIFGWKVAETVRCPGKEWKLQGSFGFLLASFMITCFSYLLNKSYSFFPPCARRSGCHEIDQKMHKSLLYLSRRSGVQNELGFPSLTVPKMPWIRLIVIFYSSSAASRCFITKQSSDMNWQGWCF